MKDQRLEALLATIAIVTLATAPVTGQAQPVTADNWTPPRTADGQPDLQGIWANNSATPMERPEQLAGKQTLTDEELAALTKQVAEFRDGEQAGDLLGDRLIQQALGNSEFNDFDVITGNYNAFWLVERRLDNRTSLVVDPPDGRIPQLTPEAQARTEARRAYLREHPSDGPEDRTLSDRCLHFASPSMGSGYNSYSQILQSPEYVAILQEMGHVSRMIPLDGRPHLEDDLRLWNGDARGHWEGDTLVIETANFSTQSRYRGSTKNLRLVERYTRISPDTIEHKITLDDSVTWTQPWTVSLLLEQTEDPLFEYACHEGNYALPGILGGARAEEKAAEEAANQGPR